MRKKFKVTLVVFLVVVLGCFSQVFAASNQNVKLLNNTSTGADSSTQNEKVDQYTKLLMHMDDGTFKDECGHTVTNNGVTLDTSNKKFGNGSASFNGGSSYLSLPDNSDFHITNRIFTIDCWIRGTYSGVNTICSRWVQTTGNGDFSFYVLNGKLAFFLAQYSTTEPMLTGTTTLNNNTWYHVAIVGDGTKYYLFLNGNLESSITTSSGFSNINYNLEIGKQASTVQSGLVGLFNGNIDEFRISNIARWTSDFTPPTNPYNNVLATGITLNKNTDSLTLGQTGNTDQLTAKVTPDDTTNKAVKWTSSDSGIVSVDDNGNIKALKAGTATITATIDGTNLSASCTVTVTGPTTISLNKTSDLIDVGGNDTLTAKVNPDNIGVTWSSSDSSIVRVDNNGNIKGVSAGTAVITATTADGKKVSCTVTVKDQESSKSKLIIYMGNQVTREYYLTEDEIDNFINWYDARANNQIPKSYYVFNVPAQGSLPARKDYVLFDKIETFAVE